MIPSIIGSAAYSITASTRTRSPKRDLAETTNHTEATDSRDISSYYNFSIKLDTGDKLLWESFTPIERPARLFNKLLRDTGSYTRTKEILRKQYRVFIAIESSL